MTPEGNFEGRNILFVPHDPEAVARAQGVTEPELRTAIERARRGSSTTRASAACDRDSTTRSSLGWNGLMLRGVAEAARAFGDAELRALAVRNGEFLFRELVRDDRVLRSYKGGAAKIAGFLEDHAAVALGALALYELTFDRAWLERARRLGDEILARFWDDEAQALFDTASDAESLVTRPRDVTDNATPSGNVAGDRAAAASSATCSPTTSTRERARYMLETIAEPMARYPTAFGHALGAADMAVRGAIEVAIAG